LKSKKVMSAWNDALSRAVFISPLWYSWQQFANKSLCKLKRYVASSTMKEKSVKEERNNLYWGRKERKLGRRATSSSQSSKFHKIFHWFSSALNINDMYSIVCKSLLNPFHFYCVYFFKVLNRFHAISRSFSPIINFSNALSWLLYEIEEAKRFPIHDKEITFHKSFIVYPSRSFSIENPKEI
jgi:hypothetical protein